MQDARDLDRPGSAAGRAAWWITLLSIAIVATTAALVVSQSFREAIGLRSSADYAVGDRVDLDTELYKSADVTAVFFLRSNCAACQQAADEVRRLVLQLRQRGRPVLMVTPRSLSIDQFAFGAELGFSPDQIVKADLRQLRLRRVPSFVVVDGRGTILHVTSGRIPSDISELGPVIHTP